MKPRRSKPRPIAPPGGASPGSHRSAQNRTVLYIGDVAVSDSTAVLETVLGSCVSVCLFDPVRRMGGMNHILLSEGADGGRGSRFGVHAMELLINRMMNQGADRRCLVAKAFGGASLFEGRDRLQIGKSNAAFVREFLQLEGIPLVAQRLGGENAVHVYFHTDTGKAIVRTVDGSALPKIVHDEMCYQRVHAAAAVEACEVTLF